MGKIVLVFLASLRLSASACHFFFSIAHSDDSREPGESSRVQASTTRAGIYLRDGELIA